MITARGNAPIKISDSFMVGSFSVDLMTKHDIPSGGVNNPISAPITVTIPNQIRSRSNASTAGRNKAATIRVIDAVSITVHRTINIGM